MEAVTLAIALVGVVLVLRLSPLRGLLVYLGILCWYSDWQPIVIGGVNFTAPRIVIIALLVQCLGDARLRVRFRWSVADTFVVLLFAGELVAGIATSPLDKLLQNRSGALFDTGLVYFVVRLVAGSRAEYSTILKGLLVIAAPLAVLGAFQSVTGSNPWGALVNRGAVFVGATAVTDRALEMRRYGFFRASVNFPYSITFGFFFALVGAAGAGLWRSIARRERGLVAAGLALALVGTVSSMSSGPIMAGATSLMVLCLWPLRRHWKIGFGGIVVALAVIDIISNRHWYDVLAWYLTFNRDTAQYRIDLIEEALTGGMAGHWIVGYGLFDPASIHEVLTHWKHTDIANHYIYQVMRFGLIGLVPWVGFVVLVVRNLRRGYGTARSAADRWMGWCLGAGIAGVLSSMFSACWEGQPYNVFFGILGAAASMPAMVANGRPADVPVPVRAGVGTVRQVGRVVPSGQA